MKTLQDRIRYIRQGFLGLSRKEVQEKYGLSSETLAAWETNKTGITEKGIGKLLQICEKENIVITKDWLLTGNGLPPMVAQSIINTSSPDDAVFMNANLDDSLLLFKEIEHFKSIHRNGVVLLLATDEMLPFYAKNDYVGGIFKQKAQLDDCIAKDCIAQLSDDSIMFRRLFKIRDKWNLSILNPIWEGSNEPVVFDVDIKQAAPVIWHRKPSI